MFLITINEKLYFKIWSSFQPPSQKVILYWYLKVIMYWWLFLKQTTNDLRITHILNFWNLSFNWNQFSIISVYIESCYSCILDCILLGFTNIKINNNRKLLSHNNFSFWGGKFTPYFLKLDRTPILIYFVKWGRSSYD